MGPCSWSRSAAQRRARLAVLWPARGQQRQQTQRHPPGGAPLTNTAPGRFGFRGRSPATPPTRLLPTEPIPLGFRPHSRRATHHSSGSSSAPVWAILTPPECLGSPSPPPALNPRFHLTRPSIQSSRWPRAPLTLPIGHRLRDFYCFPESAARGGSERSRPGLPTSGQIARERLTSVRPG